MESRPRISVVMPVYNGSAFLREAVDSILRQRYKDFELIIIDDGSVDETPEMLRAFSRRDPRVRVLRHARNMGLGCSLREGVEEARAEWVARMDADDIAHPDRLARQFAAVREDRTIDILGTQAVEIDYTGRPLRVRSVPLKHDAIRSLLPWVNPMIHPTVLFRRRAILEVGSYDCNLPNVEDYDLWYRCAAGGLRFANLPDILLGYRISQSTFGKRGWQYRTREMRVRCKGNRLLGCSALQQVSVLIPLALYFAGRLSSGKLSKAIMALGERIDPRQRYNGAANAQFDQWCQEVQQSGTSVCLLQ